jgi:lysophospholipase L1-like esterase
MPESVSRRPRLGAFSVRVLFSGLIGLLCLSASTEARSDQPPHFELRNGDRVVFLGDTLIERDQRYGYLETLLTIANPDKDLVFRNLGWSGDTVGGVSRAGFGRPEAGFEQLQQQLAAVKPTMVLVGYGMADSFAGEMGLPGFEQGLNRLLNVIDSMKARVVLLSPIAHADLGRPLPDPAVHNRALKYCSDVIHKVAVDRNSGFVDLFDFFENRYARGREYRLSLTTDGIHLSAAGYHAAASRIGELFGYNHALPGCLVRLGHDGKVIVQERARPSQVATTPRGLRFELIDDLLPMPSFTESRTSGGENGSARIVSIQGLMPGKYELKIDGTGVATADAAGWHQGVALWRSPEFQQADLLRAAINRKNELFFHRWRPQNNTYLFGFRKHEQGNNAVEIPQFDPLVAEQEKIIARLKKPIAHVYELSRMEREVGL